jgi:glucose uptake protein GlcU
MTRLLAVVLFVCSTAATQATENLVIDNFAVGAVITAAAFNTRHGKIERKVNSQNLQISGLSTRVDSCIVLPSDCTAGQSLTFNGSALVCTDILPVTCAAGQIINYNGSAWQCHDDM